MRNILDKRGKVNQTGIFMTLVGIVTLGLILFMTIGQNIGQIPSDPDIPSGCDSTTSPNLTIKAIDKDAGTALTEGTNLYRIQGEKVWNTFTAGTGFGIDPGRNIDVIMGIDTSDFTDNAYGQMFSYKVPCSETPSVEKDMVADEIETELTTTFYNADSDASAESFSADESQTISIKVKAGAKQYFGNPFKDGNVNVLVLNLNTSEWDQPDQVYLADGTELKKVSVPQRHSAVASMIAYAYEFPSVSSKQLEIFIDMNSDNAVAPATDMTAHLYAGNYFYNSDSGEIEFGVENQEGNAVGTDASDTVTLDFT